MERPVVTSGSRWQQSYTVISCHTEGAGLVTYDWRQSHYIMAPGQAYEVPANDINGQLCPLLGQTNEVKNVITLKKVELERS